MLRHGLLTLLISASSVVYAYPNHSNQWSHRSLLYFAPDNDQQVQQFLLETQMHQCDLDERDVVVLVITASGESMPNWVKEQYDISQLYKNYQVAQTDYASILIGRDGYEKLRFTHSVDWQLLNQTIDGMPMRQREMQQASNPCSA